MGTDRIVAVVKRDCPTCVLVAPVLRQIPGIVVYSQDDPAFPDGMSVIDDRSLDTSFELDIRTVPTLVRTSDGARVEGWLRSEWESITGITGLGDGLPDFRPGCGSRTLEPDVAARRAARSLRSRRIELGSHEDELEACFDRGWTDGLPVVPPTPERVARMLTGTTRAADDVVAVVPPNLVECTVEKVAVNAVLAGCRPEYMPVVVAAVEAACTNEFNAHGLLATTYYAGPMVVVNGPVRRAIGMNAGVNAMGQGNRANATIGRALQLVIRNVGGGKPGGVDRATQGQPGKYTFCFAEDEEGSPWEPLSVERGIEHGRSAVTLFAAEGVRPLVDQLSRDPSSLARTYAACLRAVAHPKLAFVFDAMLVVSPEHSAVFKEAGWTKQRLREELDGLLQIPGSELVRGAEGIAEGMPDFLTAGTLPKFRPGGLLMVHAGGGAGKFSAIIGGWGGGPISSEPVTREVVA